MAVDDLWYLKKRDADDNRIPSKRHGRGKRWRVRNEGARTVMFDKKSDADRHDGNVRADLSRGVYVDPHAGKTTVDEYAEMWRSQQIHRDSTIENVETALRLHVRPILGDLPMSSVRPSHIRSWVKDRSTEGVLAPSSLAVVYGYVASIFKAAVNDRVIGMSPCVDIRLPEIPDPDRYIPTLAEIHAAAAALPVYYRAVVYVAAGCGLRAQEIFGLELGHVDWLRRELSVRQQMRQGRGRPPFIGAVKTRTSRRIVDLPLPAQEALARHLEVKPVGSRTMRDEADRSKSRERPVELLFTTSNDYPVNRSGWSKVWRTALKNADARAREEDPNNPAAGVTQGWGLHSLRHFFATSLIHGGASVKTVQLALGHSKPSITLDTYTHEWPEATERTRTVMESALSPQGLTSRQGAV